MRKIGLHQEFLSQFGDDIGVGEFGFPVPGVCGGFELATFDARVHCDDAEGEKAEEAGYKACYSCFAPDLVEVDVQMSPRLFEGYFDAPSSDESFDDAGGFQVGIGGVEEFVTLAMSAQDHPSDVRDAVSLPVPVAAVAEQLDGHGLSAIPADGRVDPGGGLFG
ncbi:hypothetical protein BMS3Bbin04_00804 [bacterium BMS3Bbin04]|nr:hypothetical protein BMS3Bbin04_00804 [bacterium BMS3Bbin04]